MNKAYLFLIFFLLLSLLTIPAFATCDCTNEAVTGIPQSECEALLAFYEAARGVNWRVYQGVGNPSLLVNGWRNTSPVESWGGLTVENRHVVSIQFGQSIYGMGGRITPELGNLPFLRELVLGNNDLREGIPPELGNLVSLKKLELRETNLGGTIPSELGNLFNLEELRLSDNKLTGIIPPELGNLGSLEILIINSNQLEGSIPPELGSLEKLKYLSLHSNILTGPIPPEFGSLANLERLYLDWNKLEGVLPPGLGSLENLLDLSLQGNQLSGSIPPELGSLNSLGLLDLGHNRLSGQIPPGIGNLTGLRRLHLDGNQLSGPIPEEIMNLVNLNIRSNFNYWPSSVDFNFLHSQDPEILTFMQPIFGNWADKQVEAPGKLKVEVMEYVSCDRQVFESNRIKLTWDPIAYPYLDGGYEPCIKNEDDGNCFAWPGITANKQESSIIVSGLRPDTDYCLDLLTRYYPAVNPSDLRSDWAGAVNIHTGTTAVTVFPLWKMERDTFNGMAFSNFGSEAVYITLSAYNEQGNSLSVPVNPSQLSIDSRKQAARLGTELFGVAEISEGLSWVEAASDQLLGTFFTFGSADMRMLDGAVTQSRPSSHLYFTRPLPAGSPLNRGEKAEISIILVNPMNSEASPFVRIIRDDKIVKESKEYIPGKGLIQIDPADMFTVLNPPTRCFLEIETTAGEGVIGFSRIDFPEIRTTLALNAAEPSSSVILYSAQLASGPGLGSTGMETHIKLVNPMENPRELIFTAIADNGTLLADPVTGILEGRTAAEYQAWDLFSFEGDSAVGSLVININAGGVVGDVIFTPFEGIEYAAAMPLQARPVTEAVFNHIANSEDIYTGLAFFNPGEEAAEITVIAKRGDGTVAGTKVLTLGPGERISRTLADPDMLPGTASLLNGFISISSTGPIVCQQLYGGTDLQFLAAVPPTTGYTKMF